MKKIYLLLPLLSTAAIGFSQIDTTSKILDELVVTGQYRPQSLKNSVYKVNVIKSQRILLSGATNIQQVLFNQLGLSFSNDNTLGTSDIQIMGMSGRNVKILLDGVPLVDRGDTRESLNQVDLNTIDRIEMVEGPMSVSYGSDALAGVVNLISKRPEKSRFSIFAKVQEETAGKEYYPFSYKGVHTQSAGISGSKGKWNYTLGSSHIDFDG
ncbi:MAG TPA: TonB-dependent receptor, partial [Chitinophagaceae bacterium]|nr:TonB-dependent receptor [Chitinophagaceae bacterium]